MTDNQVVAATSPPMATMASKRYPMPFVRVELVIFSVSGGELSVLLAKRSGDPYAGRWALPGGVLRIDLDADLLSAAQRVARERLGTSLRAIEVQTAVGAMDRDPRSPWALSVVFCGMVLADRVVVAPGKRVSELKWAVAAKAAADRRLAFDHAGLVSQAMSNLRERVEEFHLPVDLIAEPFTLADLQGACEVVLGRDLEKASFRRKLDAAGAVDAVPGLQRTGAFRPAQMYRLSSPDEQS